MRVGVNILNFGPGANPESLLLWAQTAESLGYHSIMISDHVAITPSVSTRYPEPFWDCFTVLTWLAGQTKRVQLGTTVVVLPYRHAVHIARLVANIDHLSGGRFIFGVGVGNAADEFAVLGADHEHRGAVGNDYLRAMLALWQGEGFVDYKGHYVQFEGVSAMKTAQQPHPPIWVGGNTERAWRRAVLFGQAWHPILWRGLNVAWAGETALPGLRHLAETLGRPMPAFCPRIRLDLRADPLPYEGREAGAGSLEQVRDDLANLRDLGAEHVTLDWYTGDIEATKDHEHGLGMLRTLAEQVLDLDNEDLR